MSIDRESSTGHLLRLCLGYFVFYVLTGVTVKYFTGNADQGFPGMNDMEFLVYSTTSSVLFVSGVALAFRWYRLESNRRVQFAGLSLPVEWLYIIPSGVCTAVVIPTTTLMYMLPISVMVAMVIMRAAVIVVSRIVDAIQIRQGILQKKVYWQEDAGVVFALAAVSINIFWGKPEGAFDFVHSPAAMSILGSYILAYAIRIYIMNYYKNTRGRGVRQDNKGFFAIEQFSACVVLVVIAILLFLSDSSAKEIELYQNAIVIPHSLWKGAMVAGLAYGAVAFVSVFIFMFKGRTATFAGLVNRLTSLIAGTTATLVFYFLFGGKFPKMEDWLSLGAIFVAVGFLTVAERRRAAELARES